MMISLIMVITNIFRKYLSFELSKLRLEINEDALFLTDSMIGKLVAQSAVMVMCPWPFFAEKSVCSINNILQKEVCYKYNDLFHVMQFLKLYFLIRSFTMYTLFSSSNAYRVCAIYGTKNTTTFVVKCMMKEQPLKFIATIFLFGIIFFGYALRIAEAPLITIDKSMDLSNYFNCCWNVLITMTTVGYGDYYPRTPLGRIIMFFTCIYGMIVVSLMVNFVSMQLELGYGELKAYTVINRLSLKENIKKKAGSIIANLGKYMSLKAKGEDQAEHRNKILKNLIETNKEVKELNNTYKATQDNNSEEEMDRNFAIITQEICELRQIIGELTVGVERYQEKKKAQ